MPMTKNKQTRKKNWKMVFKKGKMPLKSTRMEDYYYLSLFLIKDFGEN
jgi:hypothetical protein